MVISTDEIQEPRRGRTPHSTTPLMAGPPSALLLCVFALGCATESTQHEDVVRRDSAGIEIVVNRAPAWPLGSGWRLAPEPSAIIGRATGADEYLFSGVSGGVRLPDGVIVVGDRDTNRLRFYDASGRFIRAVGGEGQGPGEFRYLRELRRCRRDSLYVFDLSWKLSVFDLSGEFGRSLRLSMPGTRETPYSLSCGDRGRLLLVSWGPEVRERRIGFYRTTARLVLAAGDNSLLHDFGDFPGAERLGSERGSRPHPFGKALVHALGDGRVYVGTGDSYSIRVYAPDGVLRRIVRRADVDLELTPEHLDRYRKMQLADAEPEDRPAVRSRLREMPMPETVPAFTRLELDPAGNLWVRGFGAPGGAEPDWAVFGPRGVFLGEVEVPDRFEVLEIGRDYLLGVHRDELDVERVRLYRLVKPE